MPSYHPLYLFRNISLKNYLSQGEGGLMSFTIPQHQMNFILKTKFGMTLLNPPLNLIKQCFCFMTSIPITNAISMKGAIPIEFQPQSYIFMADIPIIKVILWKEQYQSNLNFHTICKLTFTDIYKDLSWYPNWMYSLISI